MILVKTLEIDKERRNALFKTGLQICLDSLFKVVPCDEPKEALRRAFIVDLQSLTLSDIQRQSFRHGCTWETLCKGLQLVENFLSLL